MTTSSYHTAATRAAARLDRRNAVAMIDTGARDLFGAPILAPAAPPPGVAPAPAVDPDEIDFLLDHAANARPEALPPVYFRPPLFPEGGQADFFEAC